MPTVISTPVEYNEPGLREVVVFSSPPPKSPTRDHRGWDVKKEIELIQNFSINDPEAGIEYHAQHTWATPGPSEPRHRHFYAQIRYIMSGEWEYVRKRRGAGWLGYFPEGVYYGPQSQLKTGDQVSCQFPGRPGWPFNSHADTKRGEDGVAEAGGVFKNGFAIFPDGRKIEGFQALLEVLYGRPAVYPPTRFGEVVWTNTENFDWKASNVPGVSVKRLGYFNENAAVQLIKLEPGASTPTGKSDRLMTRWICQGEVTYAGQVCAAAEDRKTISNIAYPPGSQYEGIHTEKGATILQLELLIPEDALPHCL